MTEPVGGMIIDVDRLMLALDAALAARGKHTPGGWRPMTAADLARETGVTRAELSQLRRQGIIPSAGKTTALLAWLHLDPARILQPAPAAALPQPAPEPAGAAVAA